MADIKKSDRVHLIGEISVVDSKVGSKFPDDVPTNRSGKMDQNGVACLLVELNMATDKVTQQERFKRLSVQYRVLTAAIWILLLAWIAFLLTFILLATVVNMRPLDFWEAVNICVKSKCSHLTEKKHIENL